jgi:hypothetical protein
VQARDHSAQLPVFDHSSFLRLLGTIKFIEII